MTTLFRLSSFTLLCATLCILHSCIDPVIGPQPTTTIIQGTILQIGTLDPVEGAMIEISTSYSVGGIGGGTVETPVDTIFTDNNGNYHYETEIDPTDNPGSGGFFFISNLSHPTYYNGTSQVEASGIFHLQDITLNAEITPHAYINLKLINREDIEGGYFKISYINETFSHEIISFETELDTLLLVSGENSVRQRIKREPNPSQDEIERDTLYLNAFETLDLIFEY